MCNTIKFSLDISIGLLVHKYFYFFTLNTKCARVVACQKKPSTVRFGMDIDMELMQESFPKHLHMGTARMK